MHPWVNPQGLVAAGDSLLMTAQFDQGATSVIPSTCIAGVNLQGLVETDDSLLMLLQSG